MGDCGSFEAGVSVEFSMRKKEKNTEEDSLAFLRFKKLSKKIEIDAESEDISVGFKNGSKLLLEYPDYGEEWSSKNCDEEEMIEALDEYSGEYKLYIIEELKIEDIKYLDLDLATKYSKNYINEDLTESVGVLSTSGSIYCDNDNSVSDSCSFSKFEKLATLPGARLVLEADGSGNC